MTIETSETINLTEIENLRKWAEYMPKCFTDNLEKEKYNDRLIEDRMILNKIDKLYIFIEKVTGKKPDLENCNFSIGRISLKQYEEFQELIKIPTIDIIISNNLLIKQCLLMYVYRSCQVSHSLWLLKTRPHFSLLPA